MPLYESTLLRASVGRAAAAIHGKPYRSRGTKRREAGGSRQRAYARTAARQAARRGKPASAVQPEGRSESARRRTNVGSASARRSSGDDGTCIGLLRARRDTDT